MMVLFDARPLIAKQNLLDAATAFALSEDLGDPPELVERMRENLLAGARAYMEAMTPAPQDGSPRVRYTNPETILSRHAAARAKGR